MPFYTILLGSSISREIPIGDIFGTSRKTPTYKTERIDSGQFLVVKQVERTNSIYLFQLDPSTMDCKLLDSRQFSGEIYPLIFDPDDRHHFAIYLLHEGFLLGRVLDTSLEIGQLREFFAPDSCCAKLNDLCSQYLKMPEYFQATKSTAFESSAKRHYRN